MLVNLQKTPTVISGPKTKRLQPRRVIETAGLLEKVERFRGYKENWGTYNERAIDSKACDRACHFVSYFAFWAPMLKLHVYPTAGGEVGVEWRQGNHMHAVIFSENSITYVIDDDDSDEEVSEKQYPNEAILLNEIRLALG